MRWLLLFAVLLAVPMRGQETSSPGVREKLRARILETLPASPTRTVATEAESEGPVLVLEPIVVTESRGAKALEKAIAEDKQRQETERFTPTKGGKIYSSERLDAGIWWEPGKGWVLLRLKW